MPRRSVASKLLNKLHKSHPTPVRLSDPRIQKLGAQIEEILTDNDRANVDSARQVGVHLQQGLVDLQDDRRAFNRWLKMLKISPSTARNFMNTAKLAHQAPAIYERCRHLGPTKVYKLAEVEPSVRERLLRAGDLEEMTVRRLYDLAGPRVRTRKVTGNMTGNGFVQKAKGIQKKMGAWELPKNIHKEEIRRELKQTLLAVAARARDLAGQL